MRLIKPVLSLIAVLLMAWPANSQETTFKNPVAVKLRVNRGDCGYEGPPHVGNVKIVGASLDKNFR
jgi:hypothetical protein